MRPILRFAVAVVLGALPAVALAQTGADSGHTRRVGGYIGFDTNLGEIHSEPGVLAGGELAVILDQRVLVGFAGYGLANGNPRVAAAGGTDTVHFGYGGIRVGYSFMPAARIRPLLDVLVGGGEASLVGSAPEREDQVFVAELSALAETDLCRFIRGGLGLSYRFVAGSVLPGVSSADLSGVSGRITLRFGLFR